MLGQPQDNRQFVAAPGSGNRMHGSRHTLVPVVGLSRLRGEGSILQEEGLVPRKSMFEEVRLPSLILTSQAVLMEDGIKFPFCLGGDVKVQVFVLVGDVLPEINLSRVNLAVEHLFPVICQHTALVIHLQDGEEEHVLNVGRCHHSPTLAHGSCRLYSDLLFYLIADDGFGLMRVGRVAGMGHVGMQPMSKEFLDNREGAVIGLGDVPQVGESLGIAMTRVPRTRERQLAVLVDNLIVFNDQGNGPEVQLIVEGYDVVLRLAGLVLLPLSLTGNVGHLVCWKGRSLGERSLVQQVSYVIGLIQVDRSGELFSVHHGGVVFWPICPSTEPRQALLNRHLLWDQKRPVQGIQFRVSVHSTIVTDVCPRKEANVCSDVPFLLFLQELELCRPIFSDRGGSGTAVAGRDASVGLHLGGIGAIIGREVVSGFHRAVSIPKGEGVSGGDGKESRERS